MSTQRPNRNILLKAKCAFEGRFRGASILQTLRMAGPYLLIELLLPGGTLMALLLYVYRSRKLAGEAALAHS